MNLFQHKALGGAIVVTQGPRFFDREGGGHVVNRDCQTVATFTNDDGGRFAYETFKNGLALRAVETVTLFDEEANHYLVGDVGQLGIAPAA